MKKLLALVGVFTILFYSSTLMAQEELAVSESQAEKETAGPEILFGADLMSRYIWRGIDFGNSPAIQPNFAFSWKGFSVGAWGSYGITQQTMQMNDTTFVNLGNYAETDFFISYTYKWFTVMFFDFFLPNGMNPNTDNNYYDLKKATTGHTIEGSLIFNGPEKFPLQLMVGTLLWGADKNKDTLGVVGLGDKNNFSTYIEASYPFEISKLKMSLKPFVGASLKESSWYGEKAGVINLGFTAKKEIPITSAYALPVQFSVITNPVYKSMFLVFGISI